MKKKLIKLLLDDRRYASGDSTAPTLSTITIEDASFKNVVMVFDEAVTGTNLGFTIGGTTSTTFASISGSGTTWTGVLGIGASFGETITLSYDSGTGDFADTSSNVLSSITNQSVTNNVTTWDSERVSNGADYVSWDALSDVEVVSGSTGLTITGNGADYIDAKLDGVFTSAEIRNYLVEVEVVTNTLTANFYLQTTNFSSGSIVVTTGQTGIFSTNATTTGSNNTRLQFGIVNTASGVVLIRNMSVKEII